MLDPQDLPGRYGRVVHALDRVLNACGGDAVVAGGWAVWRHGYLGRVTQDIDIVVSNDRISEFLKAASVSGFELLTHPAGRWPKLRHRETAIEVDVLPEGGRPGTATRPAATTIPSPTSMGAVRGMLKYITFPSLIELKLAAGRLRDEADIVELLQQNQQHIEDVRRHLLTVHTQYVARFDALLDRLDELVDDA